MSKFKDSLNIVFSDLPDGKTEKKYRIIGIISFVFFLLLYLMTLPASYTGGKIGLISFQYLTPRMIIFAFIFALLLTVLIPFIVFLINRSRKGHTASATGGIFISIITPFLCCSPLLPVVLGFIGSIIPILPASLGLTVQEFVVTHQTEIYLVVVALLLLSIYQNSKSILKCSDCETECKT